MQNGYGVFCLFSSILFYSLFVLLSSSTSFEGEGTQEEFRKDSKKECQEALKRFCPVVAALIFQYTLLEINFTQKTQESCGGVPEENSGKSRDNLGTSS